MGANATREIQLSKAQNSNGKVIEILAEMCSSWGYGNTRNQVVSQLVKTLNDKGYDVNYTCEPMSGGNGEFFVYKIENGNKMIVFSNDKNLHSAKGAVIGGRINAKNVEDIVNKILAWKIKEYIYF